MFFVVKLLFLTYIVFAQEKVQIAQFSDTKAGKLSDVAPKWEEKSFSGKTDYEIVTVDARNVLFAKSKGSASGLIFKAKVDLNKTPYLNWSWRVDQLPTLTTQREKHTDDFPARIYLVVSGGFTFWKTLALNYVWTNQEAIGSTWPNPFTKNAVMFSIETGTKNLKKFISYKQNVKEDLKKSFGKDITEVDAVAIMTDMDNSKQEATAFYGDIYFSN